MKLEKILKNCQSKFIVENIKNINLKGISTNSNDIKDNFLFGAIKGNEFNGEEFIKDLILGNNSSFINLSLLESLILSFLISRMDILSKSSPTDTSTRILFI